MELYSCTVVYRGDLQNARVVSHGAMLQQLPLPMDAVPLIASKRFTSVDVSRFKLFLQECPSLRGALYQSRGTSNKESLRPAFRPSLTSFYLRSGCIKLGLCADLPDHYQHIVAAPVERYPAPPSASPTAIPQSLLGPRSDGALVLFHHRERTSHRDLHGNSP